MTVKIPCTCLVPVRIHPSIRKMPSWYPTIQAIHGVPKETRPRRLLWTSAVLRSIRQIHPIVWLYRERQILGTRVQVALTITGLLTITLITQVALVAHPLDVQVSYRARPMVEQPQP